MPGTTDGAIDNEPVGQGAVIVGAVSADSEHVGAEARQQHRLARRVADELRAVGELGESNSLREIRPGWPCLIFGHFALLPSQALAVVGNRRARGVLRDLTIKETGVRQAAQRAGLAKRFAGLERLFGFASRGRSLDRVFAGSAGGALGEIGARIAQAAVGRNFVQGFNGAAFGGRPRRGRTKPRP